MVGVALVEEAVTNGIEVFAIIRPDSRRRDRLPNSGLVHIVESDLDGIKYIEGIPAACDVFYHFAWLGTDKSQRNNPIIQAKNIPYTFDAVDLAKRCGCKKFIGAGSQAEYGPVDGVIDDETRFAPNMAYGIAKYASGLLSRRLCDEYGLIHIWGRIFSVYGKYDNEGTMLDYAIKSFLNREKAQFSAGVQMWDYLYERDAGKIFLLLGVKCDQSASYRIANGKSRKLKEYICIIAKKMNAENLSMFSNPTDKEQFGLSAETLSLEKKIGYRPCTPFEEGIDKTIKEYKYKMRQRGQSGNE